MPALTKANNATSIFLTKVGPIENFNHAKMRIRTRTVANVPWSACPSLPFCVSPQSRSEHLDSRGGSCDEFAALVVVEGNPDRHALSQPHPVERWIDVGEQGRAGAAVSIFDASRHAFHGSAQRLIAAHQPHINGIADMYALQLGLLEIALD